MVFRRGRWRQLHRFQVLRGEWLGYEVNVTLSRRDRLRVQKVRGRRQKPDIDAKHRVISERRREIGVKDHVRVRQKRVGSGASIEASEAICFSRRVDPLSVLLDFNGRKDRGDFGGVEVIGATGRVVQLHDQLAPRFFGVSGNDLINAQRRLLGAAKRTGGEGER